MKIVILMSTWQGARYVEEQLHSILNQLPACGRLIVRDDGSKDATVAKIEGLKDVRVTIIRGHNVGFVRSFFSLLDVVPDDADLIMFSDQDDVWLPGKIARAAAQLKPLHEEAALYCSRLQLVSKDLMPLGLSPAWGRPPSFRNAITENIVTGCTCAINRKALVLVRRYGDASRVYFHDWWLYLVISAFGRVIVDPQPTILYRQHGGNAIGMGSGLRRYLAICKFLRKKNWIHIMYEQIDNFRIAHGASLNAADQLIIEKYFDHRRPSTAVRLLFTPTRFRQSLSGDILMRLLLLGSWITGRGFIGRR